MQTPFTLQRQYVPIPWLRPFMCCYGTRYVALHVVKKRLLPSFYLLISRCVCRKLTFKADASDTIARRPTNTSADTSIP